MQLGNRRNQHSFAQIPQVNMARSKFDRSFAIKDTFDFDYLIPIFVDEVIPGDTHSLTVNAFARLATQIVPIMDNMYMDYFFFFVPNRLTYSNWEKLNGAQDNPGDSTDFIMPQLTPGAAFAVNSIFDKYGLPTGVANVVVKNTCPLRSYIKIWNDWFRDENLQNSITLPTGAGPDTQAMFSLQKRGKRKDYFTGALPFLQKGPAVSFSLAGTAPVWGSGTVDPTSQHPNQSPVVAAFLDRVTTDGVFKGNMTYSSNTTSAPGGISNFSVQAGTGYTGTVSGSGNNSVQNTDFVFMNEAYSKAFNASAQAPFYADATGLTAGTVNQLRQSIMMQSLFELDARGGTRYVEILKAHFNVISPDFRLQRAEYLGGGTVTINHTQLHKIQQL